MKAEAGALDPATLAARAYGELTRDWPDKKPVRTLQYNARSAWQLYQTARGPHVLKCRALAEFTYARAIDAAITSPDALLKWRKEESVLGTALVHNTRLVLELVGVATALANSLHKVRSLQAQVFQLSTDLRLEAERTFTEAERAEFERATQAWSGIVDFCLVAEGIASFAHLAAAVMPAERQALAPRPLLGASHPGAKSIINDDIERLHASGVEPSVLASVFLGEDSTKTRKIINERLRVRRLHQTESSSRS